MTTPQQLITIAVVALGTMITRFLPFLLFPSGRETPPYVRYLGRVLPAAALGLLVIYCVKDVAFFTGRWHGLPELISMALVTASRSMYNSPATPSVMMASSALRSRIWL